MQEQLIGAAWLSSWDAAMDEANVACAACLVIAAGHDPHPLPWRVERAASMSRSYAHLYSSALLLESEVEEPAMAKDWQALSSHRGETLFALIE